MTPDAIEQIMQQAVAHFQAARLPQAEGLFRQILADHPNHAGALHGLGVIAHHVGQNQIAADLIGRAIRIQPSAGEYHSNLAAALIGLGNLNGAITACRAAIQFQPDNPQAHNNLGYAFQLVGQFDLAISEYRAALGLRPDYADCHNNLGNALQLIGRFDDALAAYQTALRIRPGYADVHNNLGGLYKWRGELDQALEHYRRAVELRPDAPLPHGNLIYTMHFCPQFDARALLVEHRAWNDRHARPLAASIKPHANDRSPDRPLRIGYVSPDFREHPVGRFMIPLLENHDRSQFQIICYSDVLAPDEMTQRIRRQALAWNESRGLSDEQLAQLIRNHQIDILVDLALFLDRNRLLTFARKPAPVQVTYLGYCSTSGLDAMDYRLSDPQLDPPGMDESIYSERTIRLPATYWCYQPPFTDLEPDDLPARRNGFVTFGSFNNLCKVAPGALLCWCNILRQVPDSRLLLHTHEGSHRQRLIDLFASQQIESTRVKFVGFLPLAEYMKVYQSIDIALDPFPYNGGTTTCDALWMGVPVITLSGATAVARAGVTLLTNIVLPELIATSEDEYVRIASDLAGDLNRLAGLRSKLRRRMEGSPLMDANAFARGIEDAYRVMWRQWCGTST